MRCPLPRIARNIVAKATGTSATAATVIRQSTVNSHTVTLIHTVTAAAVSGMTWAMNNSIFSQLSSARVLAVEECLRWSSPTGRLTHAPPRASLISAIVWNATRCARAVAAE